MSVELIGGIGVTIAGDISPILTSFGQAQAADGAVGAQRLGLLQLDRVLGEPQVGIPPMARHRGQFEFLACHVRHVSPYFLVVVSVSVVVVDR